MPLTAVFADKQGIFNEHTLFETQSYSIGRSDDADIRFDNPQVSRRHASLQTADDGSWHLSSLGSTGCFYQGRSFEDLVVQQECVVRVGPVGLKLSPTSNDTLFRQERLNLWRKSQVTRLQSRLVSCEDSQTLVDLSREALCQALGCERAALLVLNKDSDVETAIGFEPWMAADDFSGSRTIIRRAVAEQLAVAIGDIGSDRELSAADSVIRHGIRAAVAVPLEVDSRIGAVLYGDATQSRSYFTSTDVDMVNSLVSLLSLRLLQQSIDRKIAMLT